MYEMLNIPAHTTCRNCGECCGVIPANDAEIKVIRDYLVDRPDIRRLARQQSGRILDCPFRDHYRHRCAIYPVRPLICRLCGVSKGMGCANGNSIEIDGRQFLRNHSLDKISLLNNLKW